MSVQSNHCTAMERCLFDLNGVIVLKGALSSDAVANRNCILDELQDMEPGEWRGGVHGHGFTGAHEGLNLQQIYEAGPAFERLIDHPSRIDRVTHFLGTDMWNFDAHQGSCFIDEGFASFRG